MQSCNKCKKKRSSADLINKHRTAVTLTVRFSGELLYAYEHEPKPKPEKNQKFKP
jgi:hypothetical protein